MNDYGVVTPIMKQFREMKRKHPDAILLFRVGDFYEAYEDDAVKCADTLGITLTCRTAADDSKTRMAGFPHYALDTYLPRLIRAGLRVAICDQLEDPKPTVKRGITELVTPVNDNGKEAMKFTVECRENGIVIDEFDYLDQAREALEKYEAEDIEDGTYEPNFYSIGTTEGHKR
ncbi:MAG: hypothetical protein IJ835_06360 [Muribaculaceae bacterium]|nr:hypothetical protein [Muribaculaceae bacterium]